MTIKFTQQVGNFSVNEEKDLPDDVAKNLIADGLAVAIDGPPKVKPKVFKTIDQVVSEANEKAEQETEKAAQRATGIKQKAMAG